jgi:hypothetical protein
LASKPQFAEGIQSRTINQETEFVFNSICLKFSYDPKLVQLNLKNKVLRIEYKIRGSNAANRHLQKSLIRPTRKNHLLKIYQVSG